VKHIRCNTIGVIAGLDPAIQLFRKKMDARVKPGHDSALVVSADIQSAAEAQSNFSSG
jgi:hypothetical protein